MFNSSQFSEKKFLTQQQMLEVNNFQKSKTFLTQQHLLEVQTYQKNKMYNIATKARSLRFSVNDISGVPKHVQ